MWTRALTSGRGEAGTSLVEVLAAMVVTTVGTLSMAGLIIYGTRLQTTSRDMTMATALGRQQFERIRMLPPLHPAKVIGGSLTADAPGTTVTSGGVTTFTAGPYWGRITNQNATFRLRWQVSNPLPNTGMKHVDLVVLPNVGDTPVARIAGEVWP